MCSYPILLIVTHYNFYDFLEKYNFLYSIAPVGYFVLILLGVAGTTYYSKTNKYLSKGFLLGTLILVAAPFIWIGYLLGACFVEAPGYRTF